MNSRAFISVFVTASILLFPGVTFAKTASCPCSPCKCSPCTCGGGGSKGKGEIAPPGTFNVNNDDEKPPDLPKGEVFTPKTATIDDVKKAHDDYLKAWSDWVKKQPNWNSLVHDWTQSPRTEEGNEKSAKAKKKIDKLNDQFNAGDGKQLVDDWK